MKDRTRAGFYWMTLTPLVGLTAVFTFLWLGSAEHSPCEYVYQAYVPHYFLECEGSPYHYTGLSQVLAVVFFALLVAEIVYIFMQRAKPVAVDPGKLAA